MIDLNRLAVLEEIDRHRQIGEVQAAAAEAAEAAASGKREPDGASRADLIM
jgi:hypothetical protein